MHMPAESPAGVSHDHFLQLAEERLADAGVADQHDRQRALDLALRGRPPRPRASEAAASTAS